MSNITACARTAGTGHRRRYSKAHMSRSSVSETIEAETSNTPTLNESIPPNLIFPTAREPVFVVDSDTASIGSQDEPTWNDKRGIVTLQKFYVLRDEAQLRVTESKRVWRDTPFSIFTVQSFQAPDHPEGMQALLEHSVQNFGPLPSELCLRRTRSRPSSRSSPYPQNRISKTSASPEQVPIQNIDKPAPSLEAFPSFVMEMVPKTGNTFGLAPDVRPRVGSTTRQNTLSWPKRSTRTLSTDQKENVVGTGSAAIPGDGLRLHRPRPRRRPGPGDDVAWARG